MSTRRERSPRRLKVLSNVIETTFGLHILITLTNTDLHRIIIGLSELYGLCA